MKGRLISASPTGRLNLMQQNITNSAHKTNSKAVPLWQKILAESYKDPLALLAALGLKPDDLDHPADSRSSFAFRVPAPFVERMEPGNPQDPLLLQVLSSVTENLPAPGFSLDPVGELAQEPWGGLLQKYQGRVLITATGACAVHCRYCFRRHFPYNDLALKHHQWAGTLNRIAADGEIEEVILSGGDPFTLSDQQLAGLIEGLAKIDHLQTLRIHTRTPVAIPQRVTRGLVQALRAWPKKLVIVVHINHPAEIDQALDKALKRLTQVADHLFNQAVLLASVNDDLTSLTGLSKKLFHCQVLPYYLHMLDPVQGSAHFLVSDSRARELIRGLRDCLPGYLVPKLVREVAGGSSKEPL